MLLRSIDRIARFSLCGGLMTITRHAATRRKRPLCDGRHREKGTIVRFRISSFHEPATTERSMLTAVNATGAAATTLNTSVSSSLKGKTMNAGRRSLVLSLLLGMALGAPPGISIAQNYPDSVKQLVGATKKQVKTINLEQFKAAYDKKEVGVLVDVRNEDEFVTGYVPGAVNVPRGLIEFTIWETSGSRRRPTSARN
jgi:hypothetical protein